MDFKEIIENRLINEGFKKQRIRLPQPWPHVDWVVEGDFITSTDHNGYWHDLYSYTDKLDLPNRIVDYAQEKHKGKVFWVRAYADMGDRHIATVFYTWDDAMDVNA